MACLAAACTNKPMSESQAEPAVIAQAQENDIQIPQNTKTVVEQKPKKVRHGEPLASFIVANFVGSDRCAVCHDLLVDAGGNDMSIANHWRSTMMANAAKDPLWQAKVSSEVARNPALQQVIETKCATCHMPMAWTEAYAQQKPQTMFEDGFLNPRAELHAAAMDGVSCSLCHQIVDDKLGTAQSFSGKFTIDTDQPAPDRKIYGPYHDAVERPMRTSVGYTPVYGSHINDSALCGTCHTLFTPFVDAEGKVIGEFPEQTPYLEWKHSEFGVSADRRYDIGEAPEGTGRICQECHMPHSPAGGVMIAKWAPPEVKEREHFSQHHFVGGNVFMLNILQDANPYLNLTASTEKLEDTKTRTLNQLQGKSGSLSLTRAGVSGQKFIAELQVENLAGHKFPTGFPSRRLWLHVRVKDSRGKIVFESGRPSSDGRIAGNNADEQPGSYEPHYAIITAADQVQIYETIMEDTDGAITYTLMRAARYRKDNRLLPRGFDKGVASADIAVYGLAAQDESFVGGGDRITYEVPVPKGSGPYMFTAELLYTSVSYNFMQDLKADAGLPLVARFAGYYDKADKSPVIVAALQAEVR
jgi:hypothetical protein